MELCLYAALKRDPQGLALHFYKIDQPPSDTQGQEAFAARFVQILRKVFFGGREIRIRQINMEKSCTG